MTSAGPSVDQLPPPPSGHRLLVEGQAAIPFSEGNEVFYNKVQVFNRDLSIHVIKLFAEKRLREKDERCIRKTRRVSGCFIFTWYELVGVRFLCVLTYASIIILIHEVPGTRYW